MQFLETSKPLQLADLQEVENEFGICFPLEFKEHYLKHNGGYPEKDKFKWESDGITRINTFFSIKHTGFVSLESVYRQFVIDEQYLPIGIVPFASDDGGNDFCISVREADYNCVYYCNHDHYEIRDRENYLELLTRNFSLFLNNLT
jgi:cell wall assembly regulator SMI1